MRNELELYEDEECTKKLDMKIAFSAKLFGTKHGDVVKVTAYLKNTSDRDYVVQSARHSDKDVKVILPKRILAGSVVPLVFEWIMNEPVLRGGITIKGGFAPTILEVAKWRQKK